MNETITDAAFNAVLHLALHEGAKAAEACVPTPVQFRSGTEVFPVCDEGLCGFAWVTIKPATTAFARWLKKADAGSAYAIHKGCYGGLEIWPRIATQSHERKVAWAEAVARRLRAGEVDAHAGERLD